MNTASRLTDNDLLYLARTLLPGSADLGRMVRVLREDEEILEGMLGDIRVFHALVQEDGEILRVSPFLYFTVLLKRTLKELRSRRYTVEVRENRAMAVFDTIEVVRLLEDRRVRIYLAEMLASFVRINTVTIPVRVRRGVWRRLRFSDFDLASLINFSQGVKEDQRFPPYRRIADVCLFTVGVFPERLAEQAEALPRARQPREAVEECGRYFYRAAAAQGEAQLRRLNEVLLRLADGFVLASKPLAYLAGHYLGPLRESFFLQQGRAEKRPGGEAHSAGGDA